jgi:hypothetical protein
MNKIRKSVLVVAAMAAAALGGSALADAASKNSSSASSPPAASSTAPPAGAPAGPPPGPHLGANGQREEPLTGDVAAKVKAAALDKYTGATVERVETDVDHGSPYEAHVTTSDGKHLEVLVSKEFEVTDANEMPQRP